MSDRVVRGFDPTSLGSAVPAVVDPGSFLWFDEHYLSIQTDRQTDRQTDSRSLLTAAADYQRAENSMPNVCKALLCSYRAEVLRVWRWLRPLYSVISAVTVSVELGSES